MKMGKEIIIARDAETEKNKLYRHKRPIFLKDADIEKVYISNQISFSKKSYKYFIGYFYYHHIVRPLHIMLRKPSANVKSYDGQIIWMYFLIEDDDLLEKYNTISD